ncbi:cilia- and flagella-associated protein 251-like [Anopheles ziemanni]|uniref:cilia- and flagella-associated protein 251-like n=1 Tax=Anopheles coustani TaxID=139045 RepID=UPI0026588EC4|nr:cilia- and flagella-associated protein 251-like [Anopheles coustani]XP_058177267.1 cilia- and flagella-associated protein 251-like [Anopheles ziemanni]
MAEIVEFQPDDALHHGENVQHRCHPLHLSWVSGFNPRVPLLNVSSRRDRKELVLASGSALLFYSYDGEREKVFPVTGHKAVVNMIGCDGSGRFVVSSDCSYSINVWDRVPACGDGATGGHKNPIAIRTIFEPFKASEISAVALSREGKYLLAGGGTGVGGPDQGAQLKLWSWTVGNDFPDDTLTLPARLGRIKTIHFCPDRGRRHQFVVTLGAGVVFGAWDAKEQRLSMQVPKRHGFQDYNDSAFVEGTDRAVSVTAAGMAIVWNDDRKTPGDGAGSETALRKEFLKYLHLKYAAINVVRSCDEKIVTGDDDGEIRFYDNSMKILYWFKQEDLEPIRTLSFELVETRKRKPPAAEPTESNGGEESNEGGEQTETRTQPDINIEEIAPKDVSFDAKPVIVRGFVSATKTGKIYDIDIVYHKIQELFLPAPSIITAFDVHPRRSELCACDGNGRLVVYDLKTRAIKMTLDVPIQRTRRGRIITLVYSPCGTFLAGGAENGYLWMVEPNIMILAGASPLQFVNDKIRRVMFSSDSKSLLCVDDSNTVTLLQREKDDWQPTGRCATHRIVDLAFLNPTDFVSIGDDRYMVKYTIDDADMAQLETLSIVQRQRIEQSARPTGLLVMPGGQQLLVANDQLKFKVFHARTFDILHTYSAPFVDGPARCLRLLPGEDFFLFITHNNIYLHHLPIDGNPFKYMAVRAHPKRLSWMQLTWTERCAFVFGDGDHAVSMWKINTGPVLDNLKNVGTGLDPFCMLLPGGKRGCYVREILSLFFYNQISPKNSDGDAELTLRDAMDTRDVPNYMRSIGFHMSEYEEQNLCKEMELLGTYFLTFEEVTKLFLNHRPSFGCPPNAEDIRTAVTSIGATTASGTKVDLVRLITILSAMGEPMDPKTSEFYCRLLFPAAFESKDLPDDLQEDRPTEECEGRGHAGGKECSNCIPIDVFTDRLS